MTVTDLTPMLTVKDANAAVAFYRRAFGAEELSRVTSPSGQAVVDMAIDGQRFQVVDQNAAAQNPSPDTLGGTTVRVNLIVDDPDAAAEQAIAAGARLVFPIADQPYGMRQGRIADPSGHHWLLGRPLETPDDPRR